MKNVDIVVSMPEPLHRTLLTMRKEGYTPSGYIRFLLGIDFRARKDSGWTPGKGWMPRDEWQAKRRQAPRPPAKKLTLVK